MSDLTKNNPNNTILLGGDFNSKNINWENYTVLPGSDQKADGSKLLEILAKNDLSQQQCEPTRLENILDLFCTNAPGLVKKMSTIPGISDHAIPVADCAIRAQPNRKAPRRVYQVKKAKWEDIKEHLLTFRNSFLEQCTSRSIEDNWNEFKGTLLKLMEKYVPSRTTRCRQNLPWWNWHLKRLVRRKQRRYNKAKKSSSPTAWAKYRLTQEMQKALDQARWDYVNNILIDGLENNNSKPFWRFVKSRRQDSVGVDALKDEGILHTDSKEKAHILNHQFQRGFTQEDNSPLSNPAGPSYPSIGPLEINVPGIAKLLSSLKVNKAASPDDLPCHILKELAEEIAALLTHICNQSLKSGKLLSDWVKANVAPIYKKGNTNLAENYRPVSFTCMCCKILEHVVLKHVLAHFEQHNILTRLQHGFRAAHSCVTQLVTTVQDLMSYRDRSIQLDVIVLDFSKAFNTVPHNRLLHKLHHYGIRGELNNWICSFLNTRYQWVVVDGAHSDWVHVDSGVPQSTVMGPLLFFAHINDLPTTIQSQCHLFADDCLLYQPINSLQDKLILQEDLQQLQHWVDDWGMRFNASKCQLLRISHSQHPL